MRICFSIWPPLGLALALLLGACSPATVAAIGQAKKGVVEPRIDAAYNTALKVWCAAPADTHNRAIERNAITPRSLTDNCPAWRAIRDALIGETMERLGMDAAP